MSTTIRKAWLGLPVAMLMIAGCGGKPAEQATEAAEQATEAAEIAIESAAQAVDAAADAGAAAADAAAAPMLPALLSTPLLMRWRRC